MSETIQTQKCTKCKQVKPVFEFHQSKKYGFQRYCILCTQKYMKQYRTKNKGALRQYDYNHKKEHRSRTKKYYKTMRGFLNSTWHGMVVRCSNPKYHAYNRYGGRGIKVNFACFEHFYNYVIKELKVDPRGLTIDRIDNNGHYEKGNIRFISRTDNLKNR